MNMQCTICGQRNVDGALDDKGDCVCVDCWANGEAACRGREATQFVPAVSMFPVTYPADMQRRFLDSCNGKGGGAHDA